MPVLSFTGVGLIYPQEFVANNRAQIRAKGIASHYARRALPWQYRSAVTIAKMPYTALVPTPRLGCWRIMFGYFAHELAKRAKDLPGKLALLYAGKHARAGTVMPKIAPLIQVLIKDNRTIILDELNRLAPYNYVPHPLDPSKRVFPSRVFRTAHTVKDLEAMFGKVGEQAAAKAKELLERLGGSVIGKFATTIVA